MHINKKNRATNKIPNSKPLYTLLYTIIAAMKNVLIAANDLLYPSNFIALAVCILIINFCYVFYGINLDIHVSNIPKITIKTNER